MVCTHLRELYQLCEKHELKLAGTDLIRIVCKQCELEETCPSNLLDPLDERDEADRDRGSESSESDDKPV